MIIDGKKVANSILEELKLKISKLDKKPTIAVIIVGEDPASKIYVKTKHQKAQELGMNSIVIEMPADVSQESLLAKINELNNKQDITGILVQMPLPAHIDSYKVIEAISPLKDVDGFSYEN
ncbi:MAG: bifunctional 5,10-methylene-tetrahydrofolate dehydrogenase/5,10-methylene-tetrahydrofolate cyclohydrolase, partial [Alphaproteobacteria bacterium]|nr:bifunctional 5,10-methylene-tetrahydrofolate dehydrogenase/5,10-methylene-tetrahydrofolate cyclohydrolase [Alphaproteobacteria bacterium]